MSAKKTGYCLGEPPVGGRPGNFWARPQDVRVVNYACNHVAAVAKLAGFDKAQLVVLVDGPETDYRRILGIVGGVPQLGCTPQRLRPSHAGEQLFLRFGFS